MISSIYSLITGHVICNHCFIQFIFLIEKLSNFSLFKIFFSFFLWRFELPRGDFNPSQGFAFGNPWTKFCKHYARSSYKRKCFESNVCWWQRSWCSSAWYWKVSSLFISYLFYLAEIKLKSTNSIIMHVDSQEPFRFLLFAYQFVPYPA